MVGQTVMRGVTTQEIKVGHLKSGMYFIAVNDGEQVITKKFIKQ